MQITEKAWVEYITKMSQISQKAADLMEAWVQKNGFGNDKALLDYAFALSQHYGQAIGALSCQMYEATAAAQGVVIPPAEMADLPEYGEVAKAVHGTMKQSQLNVPATLARLVKQVGADTTLKNAQRDGAQFAWVPHGDTCAFCLTLASRGWQYMSKKALKNGHAEHIHAHCDCEYAVRFDEKSSVAGYDPEKYLEEYNAADGDINAMRRIRYKQNKDVINARKRELYVQKNGGGVSGAYTNTNDPDGKKREKAANDFYEEIRNRKPDFEIVAVAKNSGMDEKEVERIFAHVFLREHKFEDGSIKRFDADYYMQNSWMRLREGKNIQPHDLILLQHELAEEKIMGEGLEIVYEVAHNEVEKKYNYAKALMEYLREHDA